MCALEMCTLFVFIALAYAIFDYVWRHPRLDLSRKTKNIIVTGCDSGFGNLFARRLDKKGFSVFAGCLTEAGVKCLMDSCSSQARPFLLDVAKEESVEQALEYVKSIAEDEGVWALVNNAGIQGSVGQVSWMKREDYEHVFNVNFHGFRHMCEVFLPLLKQTRGRIINTASIMGRISSASVTPYCVSKHGVEAFSDALRRDLRYFGVSVHIIEPSYFKTNILNFAVFEESYMNKWSSIPGNVKLQYGETYPRKYLENMQAFIQKISSNVDHVVDAYEHAVLAIRPRTRYAVGMDAKLYFLPISLLPDWVGDWLLDSYPLQKKQ